MTVAPAHKTIRADSGEVQIPEVASIVERALEAGLAVIEDRPGTTPYATAGVTVYQPSKRPPATLVAHWLRAPDQPFILWGLVVYDAGAKAPGFPTSDPAEAEAMIDTFLETYRCPTT